MKTSDVGISLIKSHEGLRLEAYPDPAHGWKVGTIGFGHTSAAGSPKVTRGMKITEAGATEILRADLGKFEGYVSKAVTVPLTQWQFDALVSFTFNLGPGNLRSSTLLRKLNARDYDGAADEFLKWTKAGGRILPGLVKRRAAERALFLSPATPKPAPPVHPPKPAAPPASAEAFPMAVLIAGLAVLMAILFIGGK